MKIAALLLLLLVMSTLMFGCTANQPPQTSGTQATGAATDSEIVSEVDNSLIDAGSDEVAIGDMV